MTRPDRLAAPTRPTLFGTAQAARPSRPGDAKPELRMLARPAALADRPAGTWRPRPWQIAASAALAIAIGGGMALATRSKSTRLPLPTPSPLPRPPSEVAAVRPVVVAPVEGRRTAAVAVIESVAPAAVPAPATRRSEALPLALVPPPRHPAPTAESPARRTLASKTSRAPPPRPDPPADADVDLLAAMVTRLQAADASAEPASGVPPRRGRVTDAPDDSRAAAR